MTPVLFERVALLRDFEELGLKAGDVATLVDHVPHPSNGENGCLLEVFNAVGESVQVVAVPVSAIAALTQDEYPAVRRRSNA